MPINYPGLDAYPANVEIPADADPADGESVRVPLRQLADRTTSLANQISPAPGTIRTLTFHPSVFRHFNQEGAVATNINPTTARAGGPVVVDDATTILACPLNRMVPGGADLLSVDVLLEHSVTLSTGAELRLIQTAHDFAAPSTGSPSVVASDTGQTAAGTYLLALSGSPLATMSETDAHHLTLGQLAGSISIHGVRVRFQDVSARNY